MTAEEIEAAGRAEGRRLREEQPLTPLEVARVAALLSLAVKP